MKLTFLNTMTRFEKTICSSCGNYTRRVLFHSLLLNHTIPFYAKVHIYDYICSNALLLYTNQNILYYISRAISTYNNVLAPSNIESHKAKLSDAMLNEEKQKYMIQILCCCHCPNSRKVNFIQHILDSYCLLTILGKVSRDMTIQLLAHSFVIYR